MIERGGGDREGGRESYKLTSENKRETTSFPGKDTKKVWTYRDFDLLREP